MAAVKNLDSIVYNAAKLTPDQVLQVLTRKDLTMRQMADLVGVSPSTIQKIRQNAAYKHVHPEIPRTHERTTGPRCQECVHDLHGRCSMGFPERNRPGGDRAAVHCSAFATGRVL